MIIVLRPNTSDAVAHELLARIQGCGLRPLHMPGKERVVLGALGDERVLAGLRLESHPAVESVKPILAPFKLVSREAHPADSVIRIGDVPVGGEAFTVIAGPCAIESLDQMRRTAAAVRDAGATCLRGGAFKPRTSPYAFQGLGQAGLDILAQITAETGMPAVTEVVEVADVEAVEASAAAFQVGARNMQNYRLLEALGAQKKPVLLKRGMAAKIEDLLLAAEYIVSTGNPNVILCERGIRTFEPATRNTLDLSAVPVIKEKSHLPVIVDPSHGTGRRHLVTPMAMAAAAAGADGLLIEVHHNPETAQSDGAQSLFPAPFADLMRRLTPVVEAVGRTLVKPAVVPV